MNKSQRSVHVANVPFDTVLAATLKDCSDWPCSVLQLQNFHDLCIVSCVPASDVTVMPVKCLCMDCCMLHVCMDCRMLCMYTKALCLAHAPNAMCYACALSTIRIYDACHACALSGMYCGHALSALPCRLTKMHGRTDYRETQIMTPIWALSATLSPERLHMLLQAHRAQHVAEGVMQQASIGSKQNIRSVLCHYCNPLLISREILLLCVSWHKGKLRL